MIDILLPELGEGIESVEIRDVLVSKDDHVKKDQTILILETEKASMEIPSEYDGVVTKVYVKSGDQISTNDPLIAIDSNNRDINDNKNEISTNESEEPIKEDKKNENEILSNKPLVNKPLKSDESKINDINSSYNILAAPSIKKLARELGCDIKLVHGTGEKGRITKDDIQDYVNRHLSDDPSTINTDDLRKILKDEISVIKNDIINNMSDSNVGDEVDYSRWGLIEIKTLNKIKLATAKNMTKSWLSIPQVTQFDNADITNLYQSYKKLKAMNNNKGIKVSLIPFYIKVLTKAIREFPNFNSSLNNEQNAIIIKKYINIGIAVDTNRGLVVPVIKNCEKKSIKELNVELSLLADKAKSTKLDIEDISGGSITISSLGGIGGTNFTPIVFGPQVAILGFSKAEYKLINYKDKFVKRLILPFSLTYDHRVIDGAEAAKFTSKISSLLSSVRLLRK